MNEKKKKKKNEEAEEVGCWVSEVVKQQTASKKVRQCRHCKEQLKRSTVNVTDITEKRRV